MTHNLDLGPEADVAHRLALLRAADLALPVDSAQAPHLDIASGLFLSADPDSAVTGEVRSAPGSLVALDLAVTRPGRWLALHVPLGEMPLDGILVLGFACRSLAPAATAIRVALRSGTEAGFADRFFRKTLAAHATPSVHLDALEIAAVELPLQAPWRDLVLFLRPESQRLEIRDLRLFAV